MKAEKVVVLYNPPSSASRKPHLPMSLLAVASRLEGEYQYEIIDGNLEDDPVARIVEIGRTKKPIAIGITAMPGPQLNNAVPHSQRIKAALPNVPIVWGGYFPSQHDETVLAEDYVDFCVRSQGEQTFVELVRVLDKGGALSAITGLSYKEGSTFKKNPNRQLIPLDELPEWPYEKIPMQRYLLKHYLGERVGTHNTSFGCPFACNFCAVVEMSNRRWMAESPERIARIVKFQHDRYGADAIQFHDMDFFISESRTVEFAERISGLNMHWWALGRVDELMRYNDAAWTRMKASGLKMVFSGAESGSDELLKRMNKGGQVTADLTLELAKRMKSFDIVPEFSFVMGNPPDPIADIQATIKFVRRIKTINPATEIILYIYTPVPLEGTLYEEARAMGFKFPDTLSEWVSGDWRNFSIRRDPHTPWLNPRIQRTVRGFESVLNAYYPTVTDKKLAGFKRAVLRLLGGWRYHMHFYEYPLELRAFHKFVRYQRPETTGF